MHIAKDERTAVCGQLLKKKKWLKRSSAIALFIVGYVPKQNVPQVLGIVTHETQVCTQCRKAERRML